MVLNRRGSSDIYRIEGAWANPALLSFTILLQAGFLVPATVGRPIRKILMDFDISPAYIDERISTIFLDGFSIDNVDKAHVKELSILALSSAMPGFVGAALRKGGFYGAMRKEITFREEDNPVAQARNFITIKLFNFIATDLGPNFLARGIRVQPDVLLRFFQGRTGDFWTHCLDLAVNKARVSPGELLRGAWTAACEPVNLRVIFE